MHPHDLVLLVEYQDGIQAPMGTDGRVGAGLPEHRRSSDSPGLHRLLWVVCAEACYLFIPPGWRCLFRKAETTDLA